MTKKLQLLISSLLLFFALVLSTDGYSQINYTENFNEDEGGWNNEYFNVTDYVNCNGLSLAGEFFYIDFGEGDFYEESAETVSPFIGVANGLPMNVTYSYKVYDYWMDEELSNEFDWGTATVSYGTSPTGPWTVIHTLDSGNITSADCTVKTATITPVSGSSIYLKVTGEPGTVNFTDVVLILDDVTVSQDILNCSGAPDASAAVVVNGPVCNQQNALVALSPAYGAAGLTYQWQGSTDGITYTDISGATAATLVAPESAGPWFRANVTCTASEQTTTSAGIEATFSGIDCALCAVEFQEGVEPISLVTFSTINNSTSAEVDDTPSLEDFTGLTPAPVYKGQAYTITVKGNTGGDYEDFFKAYIDFNRNGILNDAGEVFEIGSITDSEGIDEQISLSITIPTDASLGITPLRVFKLYDQYSQNPCGENYDYGQMEDYLIEVLECTTVAPDADAEQTFCAGATVANLVADGEGIKWYANASGGVVLPATQALVSGTVYYASQTDGCESAERAAVTAIITVVLADDPADVSTCESYILPALTNGVYRTATAGGGTVVIAGTEITETTTLYVHGESGSCTVDNVFVITIGNPVADDPADISACTTYSLPALTNGVYRTATAGGGTVVTAGTAITQTTTFYIYNGTATCNAENAFTVTIFNAVADDPANISVCGAYTLPELENGDYYTAANGGGDMLSAGDVIEETATIYVYAEESDVNTTCTAENSFTITFVTVEAQELEDVTVYCGGYILPQLTAGNVYYTATGGTGTMLTAGTVITSNQTVYIFKQESSSTTPCTDETSFTITVNEVDPPTGEDQIAIEGNLGGLPSLYSIEIEAEGTVIWYATEEDAINGTNPLSEDFLIEMGSHTYYATQTIDGCESAPFDVTIDIILGNDHFDMTSFSYYPNPTPDVLNLSYSKNITAVSVYNLVGQQVMNKNINQTEAKIDLSSLASGTYIVKVETDDASKTIKVVKNK